MLLFCDINLWMIYLLCKTQHRYIGFISLAFQVVGYLKHKLEAIIFDCLQWLVNSPKTTSFHQKLYLHKTFKSSQNTLKDPWKNKATFILIPTVCWHFLPDSWLRVPCSISVECTGILTAGGVGLGACARATCVAFF